MTKALVTGATGYLGQQLLAWLRDTTDWQVTGVSRQASGSFDMAPLDCGLADLSAWCRLLEQVKPDVVFHLASAPKTAPVDLQRTVTVEGTRRLCRAMFEVIPLARLVVAGSAAEYGPSPDGPARAWAETHLCQPNSPYGQAKLAQTELALAAKVELDLQAVVARIFNVYGVLPPGELTHRPGALLTHRLPEHLVLTNLMRQLLPYEGAANYANNPKVPLTLRTRWSVRDFIDMFDAMQGLMLLATQETSYGVYNLGSGHGTSVDGLVQGLCQVLAIAPEQLDVTVTHPELDVPDDSSVADIRRMAEDLGWQPNTTLHEGVTRACEAYRAQALEGTR
jgi:nucleoside-diphosphate-sugar epimerase